MHVYKWYTDIKKLPAFMVFVLVSQELGPIFQVNPRDMRSYLPGIDLPNSGSKWSNVGSKISIDLSVIIQ